MLLSTSRSAAHSKMSGKCRLKTENTVIVYVLVNPLDAGSKYIYAYNTNEHLAHEVAKPNKTAG